jgi:hypothetical protein
VPSTPRRSSREDDAQVYGWFDSLSCDARVAARL